VILVLLSAAAIGDADEVFGSAHCSAACGIFALNGTAARARTWTSALDQAGHAHAIPQPQATIFLLFPP
jgi:hypothetical protein